jgi:hypothetical protein
MLVSVWYTGFNTFIYLNPLHVSSTFVVILRMTIVRIQLLV